MSLKLFRVTLEVTAVVAAEDLAGARQVARSEEREILGDNNIDLTGIHEIESMAALERAGYADGSVAYGMPKGDEREAADVMRDALAEPAPYRCDKTVDMFGGES